jgi:DNA-binding PadR family transcriptional regulator
MSRYNPSFDLRSLTPSLPLFTLSILKREPTHGYGIMEIIYKQYDVLLSPGTLYPLLYSLEREGLISIEKVGRRKNYRLTTLGEARARRILNLYHSNLVNLLKSLQVSWLFYIGLWVPFVESLIEFR